MTRDLNGSLASSDAPGKSVAPIVPLSVQEVLRAPAIAAYSPAAFSPDARLLAYIVTDNSRREAVDEQALRAACVAWYGVASDIWLTDLETGQQRNLTEGTGNNWAPSWSPDGRYLAFVSDRIGGPGPGPVRLWAWERASNELLQVGHTDVRDSFIGTCWAGDNASVLVSLFPEDLGREGYAALIRGESPTERSNDGDVTAKIFEFDPTVPGADPSTDQVNLDLWRRDLGLIDVRTGKVRKLVRGLRIAHYVVSPDRRRVAYAVLERAEKPGSGQYLFRIVMLELGTDESRIVASDVRLPMTAHTISWSPASDQLAWRTGGPSVPDEVHVVSIDRGPARRIAEGPPIDDLVHEVTGPVWDASGRNVFFAREGVFWRAAANGSQAGAFAKPDETELEIVAPRQQRLFSPDGDGSAVMLSTNVRTKLVGLSRVDLTSGTVTPIVEENKRYGGYGTEPTISPDGASIAYVAEGALNPPDFYIRTGDLTKCRQVSQVAPTLANRPLGRAEVIEWHTMDGETLRGALVYPADHQPGTTYPLIVKVYGGSSISHDLNRFGYASAAIENLQLFATRGYAVLLADSKLRLGTPMTDLAKSIIPGITKVIDSGVADPARIGVTGHSYGGYSTLSLIVQSTLFKAAVMRAGMGDLIGAYGQLAPDGTNYGLAWSESGQGRMGGSPWEVRDRYLENSPIYYLDRVQTPLLIIHGSKDDAVPAFLADQVFTGLRRLGKPVTYARYEGENHWEGGWSYPNQIDVLHRVLDWFARHLNGDSPSQGAPGTDQAAQAPPNRRDLGQ